MRKRHDGHGGPAGAAARARPDLGGRTVAVTGGAQGIGREIARNLVCSGATVVIGDLDPDAARRTAEEIGAAAPSQRGGSRAPDVGSAVHAYALDVTDTASFTAFLDAAETAVGPLDVLVNNAGVMWVGPFDEEPESATDRMLAVNLHGVIRGVRLAAPRMRSRGTRGGSGGRNARDGRGGHIVTVASAAAKLSPPGEATYAATKHGVLGYLTGVREELRRTGVELTAVMPGVVDTDLAAGTASGAATMLQPADVAAAVVDAIARPRGVLGSRFEVTVPAYIGPLAKLVALLPQALRDAAMRRMVPNQVDATRGANTRTEYESRALGADRAAPHERRHNEERRHGEGDA